MLSLGLPLLSPRRHVQETVCTRKKRWKKQTLETFKGIESVDSIPLLLKGQSHVTVNKPVPSIIYIIAHTWPLCSAQILVDGVNSH